MRIEAGIEAHPNPGQRNLSPTVTPDDELRHLPELGEFGDLN